MTLGNAISSIVLATGHRCLMANASGLGLRPALVKADPEWDWQT